MASGAENVISWRVRWNRPRVCGSWGNQVLEVE